MVELFWQLAELTNFRVRLLHLATGYLHIICLTGC